MHHKTISSILARGSLLANLAMGGGQGMSVATSRLACALAIASLGAPALHAQAAEGGIITGRVSNQATGRYLEGAIVTVDGTSIQTLTEADGSFRLPGVPAGNASVSVTYADLDKKTQTAVVSAGETVAIDIGLTSANYSEDVLELAEFVVSGVREGSARATQEQRVSVNQKAIYSSDSFGNVVDSNIGEVMKNLPGVTIDYGEASEDATAMRIRGMDPTFALVTLDGNELASIRGLESRTFNIATQSLANIDKIELKFAPLPSDGANAMSGVVNLVSKSALQQKGRRISLTGNLSLNTSELDFDKTPGGARTPERKIMPGFTVSYSEAFGKTRPLGVAFNASLNRSYRFNNSYTVPGGYLYDQQVINANEGIVTQDTPGSVNSLRFAESGKSEQQRMVSLNLDWQVMPSTVVYLYSTWNDVIGLGTYNRNMQINAGTPQTSDANINTMVAPTASSIYMGYNVGSAENENVSFNAGVRHTFGDLKISYGANFSRAESAPDPNKNFGITYGINEIGVRVDDLAGNGTGRLTQIHKPLVGPIVLVGPGDSRSYLNLKNYATNDPTALRLNRQVGSGRDERRGANIDATLPSMDILRVPVEFQAGAKWVEQKRDMNSYSLTRALTGGGSTHTIAAPQITQFADPYFRNSWNFDIPIANWVNPYAVLDYYHENPDKFYYNEYDLVNQQNLDLHRELMGKKHASEAITAGYFMGTARLLPSLTMIAGVRYERTELKGEGPVFERYENSTSPFGQGGKYDSVSNYLQTRDQTGVDIDGNPVFGSWYNDPSMTINPHGPLGNNYLATDRDKLLRLYTRVSGSKSYENWFPNLQFKWTPHPDINVRLARTEAIGRADFGNVLPYENWIKSARLIRRDNPEVAPETSVKYDLAVEYYFKNNGMLTLALFRQDWDDLVRTQNTFVTNVWDAAAAGVDPNGEFYVSNREHEEGLWTVEKPVNAGKGINDGGEISYRQRLGIIASWLTDVEIFGSFSYANPRTWEYVHTAPFPSESTPEAWQDYLNSPVREVEISMPGIQKSSASLQLAYLGSRFTGRIRSYWVDDFVRSIGRYTEINTQEAYIRYDLNVSYKLSPRWTATFDWRNITNEGDTRKIFDRTGGYFTSGMVMNVGVRADF
jgi:iron complex outermembrane receptor protein